jgi:hypothetical protein
MDLARITPQQAAHGIWQEKYADADCVLLAGSVLRGEGTAYSDLDIVVLYEKVPHAWRESFTHQGWPVEAFCHEPQTLNYFFELDIKSGFPSLPSMVAESIVIPQTTAIAERAQKLAREILLSGPPAWDASTLDRARYMVTDLIDDIRAPRSGDELTATGTKLYELLADFHLRSNKKWSGKGKSLPRALKAANPELWNRFQHAFAQLFENHSASKVIELAAEILAPHGFLFNGYRLDAPPEWRRE